MSLKRGKRIKTAGRSGAFSFVFALILVSLAFFLIYFFRGEITGKVFAISEVEIVNDFGEGESLPDDLGVGGGNGGILVTNLTFGENARGGTGSRRGGGGGGTGGSSPVEIPIQNPSNQSESNRTGDIPGEGNQTGNGNGNGNNNGGGNGNSSNGGGNNGEANPDGNVTDPIILNGTFRNLGGSLKLKRGGRFIDEGEVFSGRARFAMAKNELIISEFDLEFLGDVNLGDVVADIDYQSGKSFMHSTSGILQNISLYIPKLEGQNGVVICSNASSFDEIYLGCAGEGSVTREEVLGMDSPRVRISSDGLYFIVLGITGTGGNGVNVTAGPPQTAPSDTAGNNSAFAGNTTYLSISGFSTTQTWQGYFGNVTGVIQLADGSGDVLYNWTLAEPEGEVYASTNSTILWTSLQCFNFTANGTGGTGGESAGGTSLGGLNLTSLESRFSVASDDVDGVNETFSFTPAGDGHDLFYIASLQFSAGECLSAKPYSSSGASTANQFEEVLLYEPNTASVVFTSLLEEGTVLGYDGGDHDFEMLVLEDGHGTDVVATTYYFFSELN